MTVTQFQTAVHELYQLDSSVPVSTDEDWAVRLTLGQTAVYLWANERGMLWRDLWTLNSVDGSGAQVTGTNQATITLPSNFRMLGGFVRTKEDGVNWTYWPVVDEPKSDLFKNNTQTVRFCWVTGNFKTGFTLNFSINPANGVALDYPYYKTPTIPSAASDYFEMNDPYFAVYYTLGKLHENDGEGDRAQLAYAEANERMSAMKDMNAKAPPYQENYVPDLEIEMGTGGFGL